ncbi:MAG: SDR family oxidoreductase [Myxococcaceae bacterium]
MRPFDFAGKTVVVTGASAGLGAVFARQLIARGASVVMVARSEDKLRALAAELGERASWVTADLGQPGAAQRLLAEITQRGVSVDVLVNNAGYGLFGRFDRLGAAEQAGEIALNVVALVELTHAFLPMIEKRQGGVIQVGSAAGYAPIPYMAVYGATKAFVLSFSEALWAELRERGVRVTHLAPGATDTSFFSRSGEAAAVGAKASPEDVVRLGLEAFVAGRASVVHGFRNWFLTVLGRFFTREFTARIAERMTRPGLALPSRTAEGTPTT